MKSIGNILRGLYYRQKILGSIPDDFIGFLFVIYLILPAPLLPCDSLSL
jgi:hypothetical protein